jgi:type I restriction enzyme M protein
MPVTKKKPVAISTNTGPLAVQRNGKNKIFSHVRKKWLSETPEERVRQEYLCTLVNEYGFQLDQIDEELSVTRRGAAQARADFLIWRSSADKLARNKPLIVVECKSDNVQIDAETYEQGANYAQYCHARFFVTHNNRETKFWKVDHDRMMPNFDEIENIPHAEATDREIEELISKLKVFKEDEFADLLQSCHNVIRNRESHDPTKAFDETAKILFVKVWVERELKAKRQRKNIFSVKFLESQVGDDPLNDLFSKTKAHYNKDALFSEGEKINLRPETGKEIVRLLEKYNLSDTSEDIKGIAFERFLGRTFRGEIGQFFTPRPIVEFMIRAIDPQEGDVICDPASGSGGFLIRFFEIVRQKILSAADADYRAFEAKIGSDESLSEEQKAALLLEKYQEIQLSIDQKQKGSRLWHLANRCIYGTDKNDRMARTSKMNMIMHGDGHGGVHHWNGFLNVNGIFDGRFDAILTNPPFGAKVEYTENILEADINLPSDLEQHYADVYGQPYVRARERLTAAVNKPIVSLFDLPVGEKGSIKTEILFLERCLNLLKPGGRMGIVLPEGVLNNPSVEYVRLFIEDRGRLKAVISLPPETFVASGATVKTSLLFLRKFTEEEKEAWDREHESCHQAARAGRQPELDDLNAVLAQPSYKVPAFLPKGRKATAAEREGAAKEASRLNEELKAQKRAAQKKLKEIEAEIAKVARRALRLNKDYPIFLYDAEKVGITATNAPDDNELYPNPRKPADCSLTALELLQQFEANPDAFLQAAVQSGEA